MHPLNHPNLLHGNTLEWVLSGISLGSGAVPLKEVFVPAAVYDYNSRNGHVL